MRPRPQQSSSPVVRINHGLPRSPDTLTRQPTTDPSTETSTGASSLGADRVRVLPHLRRLTDSFGTRSPGGHFLHRRRHCLVAKCDLPISIEACDCSSTCCCPARALPAAVTGGPVCRSCADQRWLPARRDPKPRPPGLPPVWSAGDYGGALRDLVLAYKEHALLAGAATAVRRRWPTRCLPYGPTSRAATRCWSCRCPSSPAARRRRGHQHVLALCRRAGHLPALRAAGLLPAALLSTTRQVADQAGLTPRRGGATWPARWSCRPVPARLAGRPCIVVDDVVTTGSTAARGDQGAASRAGFPVAGRRLPGGDAPNFWAPVCREPG